MQFGTSKVTEKGQVTIPREMRDGKGIVTGTTVVFIELEDGILIKRSEDVEALFRVFDKRVREIGLTRDDLDASVRKARKAALKDHGAKGHG